MAMVAWWRDTVGSVKIPGGLSFLAAFDFSATVKGLNDIPRDLWPNVAVTHLSFDAMVSKLETQKNEAAKRFDRQIESQKDRARILEERFKEAMERAGKSDEKFVNPMDMD